jgi:tyrosinase
MAVRTRRDIWTLESTQPWHPITRAYALAIGDMKARAPSDPTSWSYQAQVHAMRDGGQPDRFRGQCQHNGWFFLPWHRIYLHWFEQIVLAAVVAHPDVDDETKKTWALPYWNYTPGGERATLPPAFRERELPDAPGTRNPLFDPTRAINGPSNGLSDGAIDALTALNEPQFSLPKFTTGGFGGAPTGFNHFDQDPNAWPGMLEQTPHGSVHSEVGGDMGAFATAGLDPIFWLHHANIDRLWVVWLGMQDVLHENPDPTSRWGTTTSAFHQPDGSPVDGTAAATLDTVNDLGYQYEDTSVPAPVTRGRRRLVPSEPPPDHPAELIGATDAPIDLTGGTERVGLSVGEPDGPAKTRGAVDAARVYLTVEGIRGKAQHDLTYGVYLGLPDGADPDDASDLHYVGNLSFFGVEQSRQVDTDPAGMGLARSYDITEQVSDLRDTGNWDPDDVSVTFVPERRGRAVDAPPVTVGRVGIYVQ